MNMIINVIGWAIFGLIIGAIARLVMPGKQSMSWLMTMVLGIVGSFLGGGIWYLLFGSGDSGTFQPGGWFMSFVGALIVLAVYSYAQTKKKVA
jgi:uncharacterized membrane protein YeaQ/YmgE (transglycosylase-associated protein family)